MQAADPLEVGGCDISGVVISFVNLSFLFSINYFFLLTKRIPLNMIDFGTKMSCF